MKKLYSVYEFEDRLIKVDDNEFELLEADGSGTSCIMEVMDDVEIDDMLTMLSFMQVYKDSMRPNYEPVDIAKLEKEFEQDQEPNQTEADGYTPEEASDLVDEMENMDEVLTVTDDDIQDNVYAEEADTDEEYEEFVDDEKTEEPADDQWPSVEQIESGDYVSFEDSDQQNAMVFDQEDVSTPPTVDVVDEDLFDETEATSQPDLDDTINDEVVATEDSCPATELDTDDLDAEVDAEKEALMAEFDAKFEASKNEDTGQGVNALIKPAPQQESADKMVDENEDLLSGI